MSDRRDNALTIASSDLDTVAELIRTRFPQHVAESQRVARMRAILQATARLNRALATYAKHALVHCHGTAGTSDLTADTEELTQALRIFSTEVHEVVELYAAADGGRAATRVVQ